MDNPDISLLFYRYLCNVIGTEEVVNTRRSIFCAHDNVYFGGNTYISSGSKSEGLDIDGSDLDLMEIYNKALVYENISKVTQVNEYCPLLMDTSDCRPGYTLLKLSKHHKTCWLAEFCDFKAGELYLSSEKYRERYRESHDNLDLVTHGPCKSTRDGKTDFAFCFKCNDWILQAQSWLSRSRYQWASNDVIDMIVEFGVLFVPIGCKKSPNLDLEWRISFSFAEKLLIWSFNHVQLMCYALLKILLKEIIKHSTDELLCSYFLKTLMFWVCEETKSYEWEEKTVLTCFMNCLDRLIYCVRNKTLVHYFIPENDLFENRFNRQQHTILLSTLINLRREGWTCLLKTQTLQSFQSFLQPSLPTVLHCSSYLNCLPHFKLLGTSSSFENIKYAVYCRMRTNKSHFVLYCLSLVNQNLGQNLPENIDFNSNIKLYNVNRKRLSHLLIGLNHDAVSGWLRVASCFYANKQYDFCIKLVSECLIRCTSDRYVMKIQPSKNKQTRFELLRRLTEKKPYSFLKTYSIETVTLKSNSAILPKEMKIFEWTGVMHTSPFIYGLFLKFLCYHHLGKRPKADECLQALKNVDKIKDLDLCRHDFDILHQMLSTAYYLRNVNDHT